MSKIFCIAFLFCSGLLQAQIDPTLLRRIPKDSSHNLLNMDAVYNRPFLGLGKLPVSLGGYAEVNWQHLGTDGVSEGHQFQMRRMTLFVASTVSKRIKFLSEIELEEGGKEISVEFASMDIEFHPLLNLRGGIIMNPIGAFNQNHDGPKWEFTDRPVAATQMLPATWSNAGFGLFGKHYQHHWMFGYEVYLSGGFDPSIIDNAQNRTFLPAAKNNRERFEESASGTPLLTGKLAAKHTRYGEIGISYMGGVYNRFREDGLQLDYKRRCDVWAIDIHTALPAINTTLNAEWAWVQVDIPPGYSQQYGERQQGGYADIVQPLLRRRILGWDQALLQAACRLEYVDWNRGFFNEHGALLGDDLWSIVPALSFRPNGETVFRLNYRYQWQRDLHNNAPSRTAGFSFGLSSYF